MSGQRFVHLHNHTEYSLLDGAQKIPDLVRRARELDMPAVAMTDHGNLFGAIRFWDQARRHGIKPIIGCEVYVAPASRFDRAPGQGPHGKPYYHLILLAEDDHGFRNLVKLTSWGYTEGFYYRPRVDKELLARHHEGLICLTACLAGEVATWLRHDDHEGARRAVADLVEIFGEPNVYLEMQDQGIPIEKKVNEGLVRLHEETGLPLVATNDAHFLCAGDHAAHDVLICIGTGKKRDDPDRMQYMPDHYFKSPDEMWERFGWCPEALENSVRIAERCAVEIDRSRHFVPEFPVPEGETTDSFFEKVVRAGYEERARAWRRQQAEGTLRHPLEDYEQRLEHEIRTIREMGFAGYFLIVWDFIRFAREQGIPVGPGRGSAAGSLVAYCLRITDIDPLQYDLLFERFLNPERITMPDIDIDFCFRRRGEVLAYVTQRYGRENVAQIITFGTMAAKAAVRDAARVLDLPYAEADRIAKLVPDALGTRLADAIREVPQLRQLHETDPRVREVLDVAQRLEGLSRHASTHAAGVVITPEPVIEYAPLFKSGKDEITTQWAKDEVESIGLLKMDFLGLKTLTLIADTLDSIRHAGAEPPDLEHLPLDDEETYALFGRGDTSGVFQFESSGMRDILRRMKPERFEDLIALNALYRPGPLGSGMIDDFILRRHGKVEVRYPHPLTEPILRETWGVIVYQEQVMQIASRMAGYSLGESDLLRRAMGKKKPEVMEKERGKFVGRAEAQGVARADAEHIFDLMAHFAGYGFNKSHSAAYALVAYQTAYLKAHWRPHFLAALLTSEKDHTDKLVEYVSEARESGVPILAPDINRSGRYFTVEDDGIRFGLAAIKGVGEGAVDQILEARHRVGRFHGLFHFCAEVDRRALNRKVLESLIKSGALDAFGRRAALLAAVDGALEHAARTAEARAAGQKSLFGGGGGDGEAHPVEPELPDVAELPERERLAGEKEALGFYLSGHPLEAHRERLERVTTHQVRDLVGQGERVVGGLVTALRRRKTRRGEWMAVFTLEDTTGHAECVVFPRLFQEVSELLEEERAVVVAGRADGEEGEPRILAEQIVPLEQAQDRRVEALTLSIDADRIGEAHLEQLAELLRGHAGATPVYLEVIRPGAYRVVLLADDAHQVRVERSLVEACEALLGRGRARIGRPGAAG
ncbi:MAG: DNA polymerase III subunit alpha [Acidobacteriota bacterium]